MNLGDSYAQATGNHKSNWNTFDDYNTDGNPRVGQYKQNDGVISQKRLLPKGLKPKDLVGIPWRVAFALQADGWYLRSDIIWAKPNPMPESVTDRPTKSHEYLFLLSKQERYFYDGDAIREKTGSEMSWEDYNDKTGENGVRWSGKSGGDADQRKVYAGIEKKDGGQSHPALGCLPHHLP